VNHAIDPAVGCHYFLPGLRLAPRSFHQMALPVNGSTHLIPAYYSIYRLRKDERLSWPSLLTCSGWLTHISGHPSAAGRAQDRESSPARDRRSTNCATPPTLGEPVQEVKPIWILRKQETVSGSGICWAVCKSEGISTEGIRSVTHTHPFNGPFSGTTQVGRYQKGKTNLDFTEARDSERQWHQLGHMQVCTSLQTDNHANTPPLSFLQAGCPSCRPTNSVKALKASIRSVTCHKMATIQILHPLLPTIT